MDPHERVAALVDRSLTLPTRAAKFAEGWSPDTAVAYAEAWVALKAWARPETHGEAPPRWVTPMPLTAENLALYAAHLAELGRKPATIRKAIAGIRAWHRLHGQPVPDGVPALAVLRDHETTLRARNWQPRRAEPFTLDELARILAELDRTTAAGRRDACLLLLTFAGMLDRRTLAALPIKAVTDCRSGLLVRTPRGPVTIPHWAIAGQHHPLVCPVEAPVAWARFLLDRGADPSSPLIRGVDTSDRIGGLDDGYGGRPAEGGGVSPAGLSTVLAALLARAGVPDPGRFSLLSLLHGGRRHRRLQGATIDELAAEAGLSGRSERALLEYVRTAEGAPPSTLVAGAILLDVEGDATDDPT